MSWQKSTLAQYLAHADVTPRTVCVPPRTARSPTFLTRRTPDMGKAIHSGQGRLASSASPSRCTVRLSGLDRIARRIDFADDGCWLWTGSKISSGYGNLRFGGNYYLVHRLLYELVVGPIPEGLHTDHLCRNRLCCNPDHVEMVTLAENNRRAARPRTHCKRGHAMTPENIYLGSGMRQCATCKKLRNTAAWKGGVRFA